VLATNTYWQSQQLDDVGNPANDQAFDLKQTSWADMTALNTMARVPLEVTAEWAADGSRPGAVLIRLHNPTRRIAFFERAELTATEDSDEILPVEYSDNYVTVYPGETVELTGASTGAGPAPAWVRVTGYNTAAVAVPIGRQTRR
jgi:exo-1,4-beta-D-glucosaminidase